LRARLLAGLGLAALIVLSIVVLDRRSTDSLIESGRLLDHTHEVIEEIDATFGALRRFESNVRGYVITGNESFLATDAADRRRIEAGTRDLRRLTMDNPDQLRRLDLLAPLIGSRIDLLEERILTRRERGLQAAAEAIRGGGGPDLMEKIGGLRDAMKQDELVLLRARSIDSESAARRTSALNLILSAAILALLTGTYLLIARHLAVLKRADAKVRASESRLAGILALAEDAIISVDSAQRIILFNRGAEKTFGVTGAEMMGRSVEDLIPPRFRAAHAVGVREFSRGPVASKRFAERGELRGLKRDGTEFPAEGSISKLEIGGEMIATVMLRDITARKRAEEALLRANAELESFSYSVSHDLRAPLRHVSGFVDLLAKREGDRLDDEGRRYMGIISGATRHMGTLIDDLLAFSKMGRAEMQRSVVSLDGIVKEAIRSTEVQGRKIAWDVAPLPAVQADPAMLRLAIENLVSNAVKYTRTREEARIEIGIEEGDPLESVFYVRDNGVGFDARYADKLFGVFQRLHRAEEFEGTGIGLANVRRIIHRHGGRTWAQGDVGKGATFYFSLPRAGELS
jgi:PAS domain S-box-containing protein